MSLPLTNWAWDDAETIKRESAARCRRRGAAIYAPQTDVQ